MFQLSFFEGQDIYLLLFDPCCMFLVSTKSFDFDHCEWFQSSDLVEIHLSTKEDSYDLADVQSNDCGGENKQE